MDIAKQVDSEIQLSRVMVANVNKPKATRKKNASKSKSPGKVSPRKKSKSAKQKTISKRLEIDETYDNENNPEKVTSKSNKRKISDIDEEMSKKIKGMHKIMSQGGLTQSKQLMEKYFDTTTGLPRGLSMPLSDTNRKWVVSKSNRQYVNNKESNNNQNATIGLGQVVNKLSQSMETIYKNAVEKRNSSSSKEVMEISDNSLEINNFADFVDMSQECEEHRGEQLQTPEEHANKVIQDAKRLRSFLRQVSLQTNLLLLLKWIKTT